VVSRVAPGDCVKEGRWAGLPATPPGAPELETGMNHANDEDLLNQSIRIRLVKPAGALRGLALGFAAVVAFFATALIMTVAAYSYGSLFNIAPEFPLLLTLPFILAAMLVIVASPVVGAMIARSTLGRASLKNSALTGAVTGATSMVMVWLITAGPDKDPFDWPYSLHLLQLVLAGAAAGIVLGAGIYSMAAGTERERQDRMVAVGKLILAGSALFMVVLILPFLPLWQAKRNFQFAAERQAAVYFQLPQGLTFAVVDEGTGDDSLESNRRYRAIGKLEDNGHKFSVSIVGDRHGYGVDEKEIYGHLQIPPSVTLNGGDWNAAASNLQFQKAVLDQAQVYSKKPLAVTSVRDKSGSGVSIYISGEGVEVVARPVVNPPQPAGVANSQQLTGVEYSFTAAPR